MGHLPSSPIRSVSAAEWITAWTDPCLFPPPPFIFLALTFIEAFQRNTPQAIHFLKWSYSEKACGVGVRMCGIYKWAKQSFIFPQIFFFFTCSSLFTPPFSVVFSLFFSPLLFIPPPPVLPLLRDAVHPFEWVLQPGVYEPSHGSMWRKPLRIHPREGVLPHPSRRWGAQRGFRGAAFDTGPSLSRRELQLSLPPSSLHIEAPG